MVRLFFGLFRLVLRPLLGGCFVSKIDGVEEGGFGGVGCGAMKGEEGKGEEGEAEGKGKRGRIKMVMTHH